MPSRKLRILPDDVYDAIELGAEAFGGIGRGNYFTYTEGFCNAVPCCARGFRVLDAESPFNGEIDFALDRAEIWEGVNDRAVSSVLTRQGRDAEASGDDSRISFDDWRTALNVIPQRLAA